MPQSRSVQDAVDHFRQQPWCAKLIDAPGIKCHMPKSRVKRDEYADRIQSQDELFRTALNDENGVPQILVFHQDPDAPGAPPPSTSGDGLGFSISSISILFDLRDNVKGFNGYVHGGFLGTIMDEAMGTLIFTNYIYQGTKDEEAEAAGKDNWVPPPGIVDMKVGGLIMTASMKVSFRRPVSTPCTVLATATLNRIDGRKIFFDVDVRDETGAVCTACDGLWVSMSPLAAHDVSTASKL